MFHLSLPVQRFDACLAFYRDCFGAEVKMLSPEAANLFVSGGQVTFHDKPESGLSTTRGARCTLVRWCRRRVAAGA